VGPILLILDLYRNTDPTFQLRNFREIIVLVLKPILLDLKVRFPDLSFIVFQYSNIRTSYWSIH
jgi:hypothetical protein